MARDTRPAYRDSDDRQASARSLASVTVRVRGDSGRTPSAAQAARALAAATNAATLATLTADGDPWASLVAYGLLGATPVLCVSDLAEHGRNLAGDPRASMSIVAATRNRDPLADSRVILAGTVTRPAAAELDAARQAYLDAVPGAQSYLDFSDFTLWLLKVQRVRWVGGYGRMASVTGEEYDAALPDPVALESARRAPLPRLGQ
ncbi:MAG: pyridoxamine 5'-phosphate oxidase family protein [Mycobacteriaceae bacterium]|nr:pyridoxamine 5'-phosphate oxidase family protein [Mycobacteriaceae bacterium]